VVINFRSSAGTTGVTENKLLEYSRIDRDVPKSLDVRSMPTAFPTNKIRAGNREKSINFTRDFDTLISLKLRIIQ